MTAAAADRVARSPPQRDRVTLGMTSKRMENRISPPMHGAPLLIHDLPGRGIDRQDLAGLARSKNRASTPANTRARPVMNTGRLLSTSPANRTAAPVPSMEKLAATNPLNCRLMRKSTVNSSMVRIPFQV